MEAARRANLLSATATITTVANQATYELAADILHIKEVHINDILASKITREDVIRLQDMVGTGNVISGTTVDWHFYVERRGIYGYIGVVDQNGNAPTTAGLEIEIHYSGFPDAISSDQDTIGIPERYFMPYVQGITAEVLKMNGAANMNLVQMYTNEWERCIIDMRHDVVDSENQPMVQFPVDLSCE